MVFSQRGSFVSLKAFTASPIQTATTRQPNIMVATVPTDQDSDQFDYVRSLHNGTVVSARSSPGQESDQVEDINYDGMPDSMVSSTMQESNQSEDWSDPIEEDSNDGMYDG